MTANFVTALVGLMKRRREKSADWVARLKTAGLKNCCPRQLGKQRQEFLRRVVVDLAARKASLLQVSIVRGDDEMEEVVVVKRCR